jgi:IS1 family transposase
MKESPMNALSIEKQVQVIAALTEGCSMRATARLTGVNRETVMTLSNRVGNGCERLHDRLMRDLQVGAVELDEQWDFIGKKQKRVRDDDAPEMGDVWVFIALSATHKAVLSYVVGKRNRDNAQELVYDLSLRVLNRPQITSDGYAPYIGAVDMAFGWDVDYAQVRKVYDVEPGQDAAHRYSPARVREVEKEILRGDPDPDKISTSYVERFNLSTRMQMRRFARLTNGFSKTLANHYAAVALWIAFYNFCRVHETLRKTPAMALGVTDHVWTIGELITAALEPKATPPLEPAQIIREKIQPAKGPTLRLIPGGKGTNKPR